MNKVNISINVLTLFNLDDEKVDNWMEKKLIIYMINLIPTRYVLQIFGGAPGNNVIN